MRNIAVVTGTRAEYGLLKPLLKAIVESEKLNLQLLVTGMHLMPKFGNTYLQIKEDGFKIDAKIDDGLNGDDALSISRAIGRATMGFAEAYHQLKPELLVVLGDRSEILAAVTSAIIANIPVAHIHGGETTEGAYDEFIRHAITKMSYFHFTATEVYRNRVIQLGEDPKRVFNVGAIGIDSIKSLNLLSKEDFEKSIHRKLDKKTALITFHPVTLENNTAEQQFEQLLNSLDNLKQTTLIFTKPNSDRGGSVIIQMIDEYVQLNPKKAIAFVSLGQLRYLSALKYVDIVIGNSSSGIYEAPFFNKPTINIGDRQKGRIMSKSVISCEPISYEISKAIEKALTREFNEVIRNQENCYGDGTAAAKILKIIVNRSLNNNKKSFYDIN